MLPLPPGENNTFSFLITYIMEDTKAFSKKGPVGRKPS
jgi:hypothetical protein